MYTVPEFQNPSGVSYSKERIAEIKDILQDKDIVVIEDAPYREIYFNGKRPPSFYNEMPDKTMMLGSFSKTTVPGLRLGWLVAPKPVYEKLLVAKQGADLHTDILSQQILYHYLTHFDNELHINRIRQVYGEQCHTMQRSIKEYMPDYVKSTRPEGGMFLWLKLADKDSAMQLFEKAIGQKVAFVPGVPFYTDGRKDSNTMRLNFSNASSEVIEEGIKRLASCL